MKRRGLLLRRGCCAHGLARGPSVFSARDCWPCVAAAVLGESWRQVLRAGAAGVAIVVGANRKSHSENPEPNSHQIHLVPSRLSGVSCARCCRPRPLLPHAPPPCAPPPSLPAAGRCAVSAQGQARAPPPLPTRPALAVVRANFAWVWVRPRGGEGPARWAQGESCMQRGRVQPLRAAEAAGRPARRLPAATNPAPFSLRSFARVQGSCGLSSPRGSARCCHPGAAACSPGTHCAAACGGVPARAGRPSAAWTWSRSPLPSCHSPCPASSSMPRRLLPSPLALPI